jgi:hypothetical protein
MALPAFAAPSESPFPNILFKDFNQIIESTLGSKVTLATVLTVLFTLTENPDLLNLHFRQQYPTEMGENKIQISGWIIALVNALTNQLGKKRSSTLFFNHDYDDSLWEEANRKHRNNSIAIKLDKLASNLSLSPYDKMGNYKGKLHAVSHKNIEPALVICPTSFVCGTLSCKPRSLVQFSLDRDIPLVTLVKGHTIYEDIPVLTGKCNNCATLYLADHERFKDLTSRSQPWKRVYLNSAKYIKVGQNFWVDRLFTTSTVNAMYNFHASAAAYAEYWNNTFGTKSTSVSRAQIWQAFVQESMRTIAQESKIDIELNDNLNIKEITTEAFSILGESGIIQAADKHACSECIQIYKKTSNSASDDENSSDNNENHMNINKQYVKMIVLDGIVMGPTVILFYKHFLLYLI